MIAGSISEPAAPPPPLATGPTSLEGWLRLHLTEIAGAAQLGILCARVGVVFADVAPCQLPLRERLERLLSYLAQRGSLFALADALLRDEATATAALERDLPTLLGTEQQPAALKQPCLCQPLPPPPPWLGRDAELGALDAHVRTGARVVLLRGASGSGKSVLLGRWLRELLVSNRTGSAALPAAAWQQAGFAGVLYWSFSHDPDVHAFLRTAANYVCGVAGQREPGSDAPVGSLPPSLQGVCSDDASACRYHLDRLLDGLRLRPGPTLLVLDGLERLALPPPLPTAAATDPVGPSLWAGGRQLRPGDLTDQHLAALLSELAIGATRGLLVATVDGELPQLRPWLGERCVEIELSPLSPADGGALLRHTGVAAGGDSDVEARSLEHRGHALTLHLLGCYLHAYFQGDGRAVTRAELPTTDTGLHSLELLDRSGLRSLRAVLRAQLLALSEQAGRLLDLCALLPGPLRLSTLQALIDQLQGTAADPSPAPGSPGPSAASFSAPPPLSSLLPSDDWLAGPHRLVERLADLERLGLFHLVTMPDGEEAVDMHALVREPIYRDWLSGHGGFWPLPQPGGGGAYAYVPRAEQALDLLEQLVFLLLSAGQPDAAYGLLIQRLGGYQNHVHNQGRARRFLSLIRQIYPVVASTAMTDPLWQDRYSQLLTWEADALRVLGQLDAALVTAQRQWPLGSAPRPRRLCLQARILRCQGRLPRAAAIATAARQCTSSVIDGFAAALEQAEIALRSGDPALCQVHLLDAAALLREEGAIGLVDGEKQSSLLDRIWAQRALALGHDERARMLLERCRAAAEKRQSELDGAHCEVLLAESFRRARGYEAAGQALHRALAAAGRSGDTETLIVGGLVQGRLRIDTANFDGAAAAFGPALALASEHGYGTYRIDLLVGRGALHLRRGELEAAEQDARDALAYAAAPGCGYVGGEADALHLLATALIATRSPPGSPRHDEALAHLTDELELRERMSDPTAPEVRWLLRRLKG